MVIMYRKRTIRRMPPNTRELAKIATELGQISRKLRKRIADIAIMEKQAMDRAETAEQVLERMTENVTENKKEESSAN